ncbi:MAG: acyltransferase [Prevotellaceae bacterium]|jgi:acetyltransferase-like isoleucine patch superfamily enzyme|nr:acyltransferase [Prevotellaceae bacterium]
MKSSEFQIKEAKAIPYGGQEKSFKKTFKNGGESRSMSPFKYGYIRIRNYFLFLLAYFAPSNRIRVALNRFKGVNIADGAYIGMCVFIDNAYPEYIYIEEDASVNSGSELLAHFNPLPHWERIFEAKVAPVVIKKRAIVAVHSVVMPGVTVGENAVVSAMSAVYENVPPNTIVRGNPAVVVQKFSEKLIKKDN